MDEELNVLPDGGPIYYETDISQLQGVGMEYFPVEPWNSISSLFFLVPAIYWVLKLRGQYRNYRVITLCIPFLIINGMGSFLFHGARSARAFLFMDFVPALLVVLIISAFFWYGVLKNWIAVIMVNLLLIALRFLVFRYASGSMVINLSYLISGITIFLPTLILLFKTNWHKAYLLVTAIFFLLTSLFFRVADDWQNQLLTPGVHWLWHVFSAISVFPLGHYLKSYVDFKKQREN